mmetsp:Transcript_11895/g.31228  ORF Transcript_11895/g.31228 Transcript_11895/m.31228 type:complete len:98 (-) Transcript_11895:464-757(-)
MQSAARSAGRRATCVVFQTPCTTGTVCLINATPRGRSQGAGSAKKRRGGGAARGTNAPQTANAVVACVEINILRRVCHRRAAFSIALRCRFLTARPS